MRRRAALELQLGRGDVLEQVAVGLRPDRVDGDVEAEPVGDRLEQHHHVVVLHEVVGLRVGELARLGQPVLQVVDDHHPAGAHQPCRLRREESDRPGAEHDDGVALGDVAQLSAEVAGRQRLGAQHRIVVGHPLRDHAGPDVGERHPHVLGPAAVVPAAGGRVAVDPADGGGVVVDVVAVGVEPARAEEAAPAEDVERHHHAVADTQVLHRRSDLVDDADELVAGGVADAGVRHHRVVEVQVGPADRRELDRTIASPGCSMCGRGFSSTRIR